MAHPCTYSLRACQIHVDVACLCYDILSVISSALPATDRHISTYTCMFSLHIIGNESVPIQLARYRFPGLAISDAKILLYFFSDGIYGSNFIKEHSETYGLKLPKCGLQFQKKNIVSFIIICSTLSFPIQARLLAASHASHICGLLLQTSHVPWSVRVSHVGEPCRHG